MESKAGFFDRGPFGHFTWNPLTVCQSCIQVGEIWWNLIVCFYLCTFKYILVHCVCNTFFIHTHFTSCIHLKLYGCFLSELFWRHFNMYERNAWYDEFSLHMVLWTSEIRLMKYVQTFWLLLQKKRTLPSWEHSHIPTVWHFWVDDFPFCMVGYCWWFRNPKQPPGM